MKGLGAAFTQDERSAVAGLDLTIGTIVADQPAHRPGLAFIE